MGDLFFESDAALLESLRRSALNGAVPKIARKLSKSQDAVYKMADGQIRSWLHYGAAWLDAALEAKPSQREDALAPLRLLNARFGIIALDDLPSVIQTILEERKR